MTRALRRPAPNGPPGAARAAAIAALGVVMAAVSARAQAPPRMVDVTAASGIEFEHRYGDPTKAYPTEFGGSGGAWVDFDVDGRLDLLLVNALARGGGNPAPETARGLRGEATAASDDPAAGHRVYRAGDGAFVDVTAASRLGDRVWGNGAAVADVDDDGFPDVYVTAIGANRLYRNNGDGSFSAWDAGVADEGWGTSAAFVDWDGDADLDLYVVNYVDFDPERIAALGDGQCFYRGIEVFCGPEGLVGQADALYLNRGDGTFERAVDPPIDPQLTYGFALVATDCGGDRLPEIFVAADSTTNLLYRRDAEGRPDEYSLFSGAGYSAAGREQAGMGATAGDFDGDGDFDLYVTNFQSDYNTLYRNLGDCMFEDVSERLDIAFSSLPYMGWAAHFVDIDGDADLDLYVANGHIYPQLDELGLEPYAQRNLLYLNQLGDTGEATFAEVGDAVTGALAATASSRAVLTGDYDNDDDIDLLVTNIDARPHLLRNDGPVRYAALRLTLIGRRSNRSAYGSRVRVESGGSEQIFELRGSDGYLGSNDPRLLVYLPSGRADRVTVEWPSGGTSVLEGVAPGWTVLDEQRGVVAGRPR